jgi:hypothetical protein
MEVSSRPIRLRGRYWPIDLVVDVEVLRACSSSLSLMPLMGLSHRLRRFHQDLAVLVCIHLLPQHVALVRRQGFQRIGDIGGGQAVDQPGQLAGLVPKLLRPAPLAGRAGCR